MGFACRIAHSAKGSLGGSAFQTIQALRLSFWESRRRRGLSEGRIPRGWGRVAGSSSVVPGKGRGHVRGGTVLAVDNVRAGKGAELSLDSSGLALDVAEAAVGDHPSRGDRR